MGKRVRKASSRRQAYEEGLENIDDHTVLHTAYAAGIHRDQLPPSPRNWKEILTRIKVN
jgi:hypothetical protein